MIVPLDDHFRHFATTHGRDGCVMIDVVKGSFNVEKDPDGFFAVVDCVLYFVNYSTSVDRPFMKAN